MRANSTSTQHSIGIATAEVVDILRQHGIPYYIFAGFALHLHGLEQLFEDGDIRVFNTDLTRVRDLLQTKLPDNPVYMSHMRRYNGGQCAYMNDCIEIDYDDVSIDICSHMSVSNDFDGIFSFPYSKAAFEDVMAVPYGGSVLPVASLEFLLLYYLVLRRGPADSKADEARIRLILTSGKLDHTKFLGLIDASPHAARLHALYTERLRNIQR